MSETSELDLTPGPLREAVLDLPLMTIYRGETIAEHGRSCTSASIMTDGGPAPATTD